jgi:hypothetical protein
MKQIFAASLLISLLLVGSLARAQQTVPRFESYAAPVYKGKRAPLNLRSAKNANTFRTRLREGAKEGVNFAGHYTLVQWGCGTGCLDVGVIDVKTGTVYFPEELGGLGVWFWSDNEEALQFKPNSRLLVLSGFPASESNSDNPKSGLYYYEWTGARLKLIRLVEKKREEGR